MENIDNFNGKKVFVTGASGYIGSALVDALLKKSCEVTRVSREALSPIPLAKQFKADIRNLQTWIEIVSKADVIYHLAGNTSVYNAAEDPVESFKSTLLPLHYLINIAQKQQCKPRVVFASTATVYGLTPKYHIPETFEPRPITIYDLHKFFAEQLLTIAAQNGLIESVSLRLSNVYGLTPKGSSSNDRGILNKNIAKALRGEDLTVYGDGNYLRDYVYIADVINAFLLAGVDSQLNGQSFNVASGCGITLREVFEFVASFVAKITGQTVRINSAAWPEDTISIELRNYKADINKYKIATGWTPLVNIQNGISLTIAEFIKKDNFYES